MKTRDILVIMMCTTVCTTILLVVGAVTIGGRTLPPEASENMFSLVTFVLGTVSGYLLTDKLEPK